jgi:hypothetical protein
MANLWQTFANERIRAVKKRGSDEVEKKIMDYITEGGKSKPKAGTQEIPKQLQQEIIAMTKRHRDELEPMVATITLPYPVHDTHMHNGTFVTHSPYDLHAATDAFHTQRASGPSGATYVQRASPSQPTPPFPSCLLDTTDTTIETWA